MPHGTRGNTHPIEQYFKVLPLLDNLKSTNAERCVYVCHKYKPRYGTFPNVSTK